MFLQKKNFLKFLKNFFKISKNFFKIFEKVAIDRVFLTAVSSLAPPSEQHLKSVHSVLHAFYIWRAKRECSLTQSMMLSHYQMEKVVLTRVKLL